MYKRTERDPLKYEERKVRMAHPALCLFAVLMRTAHASASAVHVASVPPPSPSAPLPARLQTVQTLVHPNFTTGPWGDPEKLPIIIDDLRRTIRLIPNNFMQVAAALRLLHAALAGCLPWACLPGLQPSLVEKKKLCSPAPAGTTTWPCSSLMHPPPCPRCRSSASSVSTGVGPIGRRLNVSGKCDARELELKLVQINP